MSEKPKQKTDKERTEHYLRSRVKDGVIMLWRTYYNLYDTIGNGMSEQDAELWALLTLHPNVQELITAEFEKHE